MKRKIYFIFLSKMTLGTMLALSSKHWFLMWMGLEMKTISIIPLMLKNKKSRSTEASMKYFIIQAIAAAMMLKATLMKMWKKGSWLMKTPMKKVSKMILLMALFFKMGIAPFHFWFPEVMKGNSLMKGLMMSTWQKMAPTIMLISMMKNLNKKMILLCSMLSIIMGAWKGLNQTQTRKMMAFSSIKHMGWMIITSLYNQKMSLMMFFIYMLIKSSMFMKFIINKTMKMAKSKKNKLMKPWKATSTMLVLLSLGGLPPLTGFMKKILSMKTMMMKKSILLTMPLMMGSLMSLFFYLRMSFNMSMIKFPQKSLFIVKLRKCVKNKMKSFLNMFSMSGIIMLPLLLFIFN